jgi:murein DD-endopeptidase MepM/ murein hydrolase activator NlpD
VTNAPQPIGCRVIGRSLLLVVMAACRSEPPSDSLPAGDTIVRDTVAALDTLITASRPVIDTALAVDSVLVQPPDSLTAGSDDEALRVFGAGLMIPVQGVALSELRDTYGDPRTGHAHEALDIMAPRGTSVLSATNGRLMKLFTSKPGGTMVYAADTSDRFILMYGHLDRYADGLVEGMTLTRGQVIGYVGSTGAPQAGPHLHFALARGRPSVAWWKGDAVNPYPLFFVRR